MKNIFFSVWKMQLFFIWTIIFLLSTLSFFCIPELAFASSFPTIVSPVTFSEDGTFNTEQTITLPSGIVTGNLLVAILRTSSASAPTAASGWITLTTSTVGGNFSGIYYRVADGSEGSTVTFTTGGSANTSGIVYQVSGFSNIEANYATSNTIDPDALSPSWGLSDTLWITFVDGARGDWGITSIPTNYTNSLIARSGNSSSGNMGVSTASRQLSASSDDPASFVTSGLINNPRAGLIAIEPTIIPTVTTSSASSFATAATLNGSISNTGGENASQSGFAWGTDPTLAIATTTTEGAQIGTVSFSSSLVGLVCDTTYYFRAYATNSVGTGYGTIENFTTSCADSVTLTSPTEGSTVYGTVIVSATGFSLAGIAGITFRANGVDIGLEDTSSPYSVAWNTDATLQGAVTLTAVLRSNSAGSATSTRNVIKAGCDCGSTDSSNVCTGKSIDVTVSAGTPNGGTAVDGIYHWAFNSGGGNAYCGQFASGDYWTAPAVGQSDVTVTGITSNGSVTADADPTLEHRGLFDNANTYGNYDAAQNIIPFLPLSYSGINSLVAGIQRNDAVEGNCGTSLIVGECADSYNVLTVLSSIPALAGSETIRPNITGQTKELLSFSDFDFSRLPSYAFLTGTDPSGFQSIIKRWSHTTEIFGLGSRPDGGTFSSYSEGGRAFRAHTLIDDYGGGWSNRFDADLLILFSDSNTLSEKKPALAAMISFGLDLYHDMYDAPSGITRYWMTGATQHTGKFLPAVLFASLATDSTYADVLKTASQNLYGPFGGPHELAQIHPGPNGYVWGDSGYSEGAYWGNLLASQCYTGATEICNTGIGSKNGKDPYGYIDGPANKPGTEYMATTLGVQRALVAIMALFPQIRQIVNDDNVATYVERLESHGAQAGGDPCVSPDTRENILTCDPYADGAGCVYYGITWGPDPASPGQCIMTATSPYTQVGRFSSVDGTPVSPSYTVSQVESNWSTIMAFFSTLVPTLTTSTASEVAATTATLNGVVANTGGADITQSGFIWGTDPTLATAVTTTDGSQYGSVSFFHSLTNLTCGITYYFRAYATNSAGTGYGSITPFTTTTCGAPPNYPSIVSSIGFYEDGTFNTQQTITLPSNIVSGNLLVAILRTGSAGNLTPDIGWATLSTSTVGGNHSGIYYRTADGSEGSIVTFTTSGNSNTSGVVYQISGFSGIEAAYATSNTADPPEISPSWGSENTLWIAFVDGNRGDWSISAIPNNYANLVSLGSGNSSSGSTIVAASSRQIANLSEDPSEFITGSASNPRAGLIAISPAPDTTPPTLSESTPIATSTGTTPDYTFSTTEAGSLTYGGDCTSSTTTATSGSNTITFTTLSTGTHTNCTIQVTDASTNASTPLAITSFTITAPTVTSSTSSSSSSSNKKKKKKKISSKITYQKGERVAPYITLTTPKKGSLTNKKFSIKASSSDKSGIQAMFVSINGTKKKRANTSSILYTAKKLKNATISVSAYDTLGNVKVAQITVTNGVVTGVRYY